MSADRPKSAARRSGAAGHQPQVLREYALLADGERAAVVGPRGDIVWLCAPHWHDPAVFAALIGGSGTFSLAPDQPYVWGGSYDEGTMIWRSRWVTRDGIVECRETLAYPADPHRVVLLRRVHALDRPASVTVSLEPRGDYDRTPMTELHRHASVWTARLGQLHLRLTGGGDARPHADHTRLDLHLNLPPGTHHDLVLELSDRPLPDQPPDPDDTWRATETAWRDAVPALDATLNPRDTRRSFAVLRGLTSASGGMVAAATTSLPERAEAGRNYDYRYAWIRDQCYAGQAAATVAGGEPLLDAAVDFVGARILDHGDRLAPAYTISGDPVPDQRHLDLPGYPGGSNIVGNWVNHQFQLDAYGEALLLFAAAARHDRLDPAGWNAVETAIRTIGERWSEPDAGIWEIEPRAWTHSRLTAAAGLRAIATARSSRQAGDWLTLADRLVADTATHALHRDGRWQRAADDPGLDAALLLPALRGAVPIDDPRSTATFTAYLDALTRDGYAYRFRHDDRPLADAEGAFLLCGFLVALTHHQLGNGVEARSWYDTTRAATGPAQLFSEEYDAVQHQMRGNLPQAFVHALHLETGATLSTHPTQPTA
ncbi:MAG: glycoside hydrolase [Pseudonocardiales bacterium]|nr:MAG: glycoside hydrolase [Pseudonocardiales bacterium]